MLIPIESSETTAQKPFSKNSHPFTNLRFDKETEFASLEIGYQYWLCEQLQTFAKEQDIEITVRFISWDQAHNEIDSIWKEFDLIQVPSTWTAHLIDKGILAKWDGDVNLQYYPAKLLDTCRIEGKKDIYAVPWHIDLRVLFCRKELTDDPNKIHLFDDFRKCLIERKKQMEAHTGSVWKPFCIAKDRDWDILHNTLRYFWAGKIIEKYMPFWWKPVFGNKEGIEGIEKLRKMAKSGLVYFGNFQKPNGKPAWRGQAQGLLEEKYDAVFGGFHMRTVFNKRADVEILAAPLPQLVRGEHNTFLGGSHLAVTTASPKPYARIAKKLIERLTNKESGISMFKYTNAMPAHKDALKEFFETDPICKDLNLDALLESAKAYPSIPQWAELETDVVLDNFHSVLLNIASGKSRETTIEFHIQNAARDVRHILLLYLLTKSFPALIVFLAVSLVTIIWLLWDKIYVKYLKAKAEKRAGELSSGFQKAKEEILGQLRKSEHALQAELSNKLDEANNNLKEVCQTVNVFVHASLSADEHHQQCQEISNSLETLNRQFDSIQSQMPDSSSLEQIAQLVEELRIIIIGIVKTSEAKISESTALAGIEIDIKVTSEPPKIELCFSNSGGQFTTQEISGLTAGAMIFGMRNEYVYIPEALLFFRTDTGKIPTREHARRELKTESTEELIAKIRDALKVLGQQFNISEHDKDPFLFEWKNSRYVCQLNRKSYIKSSIIKAQKWWESQKNSLTLSETVKLINKDPGRIAAWSKLTKFLEDSADPGRDWGNVKSALKEEIETLEKILLRYLGTLYELTAYLKGYSGSEVDKEWTKKKREQQIEDRVIEPTKKLYKVFTHLKKNIKIPDELDEWAAGSIDKCAIRDIISGDDQYLRGICIFAIALKVLDKYDLVDSYAPIFKDSNWFKSLVGFLKDDLRKKLREKQRQIVVEILHKNREQFNTAEEQEEYIERELDGFVNLFDSITEDEWLNYLWKCLKGILCNGELYDIQGNTIILDNKLSDHAISTAFNEEGIVYGLIDSQILEEMMEDHKFTNTDEDTEEYEDAEKNEDIEDDEDTKEDKRY